MPERRLLLLVALLSIPELYLAGFDATSPVRWLSKPLPLAVLIAWFVQQRQAAGTTQGGWVLAALGLSLVGDLLLLVTGQVFFLAGLGAFLVAHLCYVVAFWRQRGPGDALVGNPSRLLGVFVILGVAGWMLFDVMGRQRLDDLFGPVAAYVAVISAMTIAALHRLDGVPLLSFRLVLLGAVSFMLSDCLLATTLFVQPFEVSGLWIMLSYYVAQALITIGYRRSL